MARKWPFRKELHHPNEIFHFAAAIGSTHSLAKQKMIPKQRESWLYYYWEMEVSAGVVVCDYCGMVDILSQILLHRIRLEVYFVTHLGSTHTAIASRK